MPILKGDRKPDLKVLLCFLVLAPAISVLTFLAQLLYVGSPFSIAFAKAEEALLAGGLLWLWPALFLVFMKLAYGIETPRQYSICLISGFGPPLVLSIGVFLDKLIDEGVFGVESLPELLGALAMALPLWAVVLAVLSLFFIRFR